jgi:hypothetical protein
METSIVSNLVFGIEECCRCGVKFGIPKQLQDNLRNTHNSFFCPNGHSQSYIGETDADKLRRELKRKEQELANKVRDELNARAEVDKLNRKLKRVHNGTCPCCKRSFSDLQKHMRSKHPELTK